MSTILNKNSKPKPLAGAKVQHDYEKVWREFEDNEITHSGAHYLLAIASFEKNGTQPRAADLARQLGVSRTAVSLQLKTLIGQKLVQPTMEQRLTLTRVGADLVARIANKRQTFQTFLEEVLDVPKAVAELDGCKVEHLLSEETGNGFYRLIQFIRSEDALAKAFVEAFRNQGTKKKKAVRKG